MDVSAFNKRRSRILGALTHLYIQSARPVSSQLIKEEYGLSISTATIRSIMAELEEAGYIVQTHTSSGRVPTDRGYRFYIDSLMKQKGLSFEEKQNIKNNCRIGSELAENIINKVSRVLSEVSNEAGINLFFKFKEDSLKCVELINLGSGKVLLVLVTESGIIRNYPIRFDEPVETSELHRISNFLNTHLQGAALSEIKQRLYGCLERDNLSLLYLAREACGIFDALEAENVFENECQICQEGINYILKKPEFNDVDKLRAILGVLEDKRTIEKILRGNLRPYKKVMVTIGKENKLENLHNCSLVTSKYKIGNRVVGVLGLLGPTRMAYSKLLPLVEYMSDILSEALSGHGFDGSYEEGHDEA